MDQTHTPGPWDIDDGDGCIYSLETQESVAHGNTDSIFYNSRADAAVLIAAPDLLGALKEAHATLVEHMPHAAPAVIEAARAAISKAEGK